jgi:hypothetical protein
LRDVENSTRLGVAPAWAKALLFIVAIVGVTAVWITASRRPSNELGFPTMAATAIPLVCAPLMSHPYVLWLAPTAAIAVSERGPSFVWLPALLLVTSGLLVVGYNMATLEHTVWSVKLLLLVRNGFLVAVPVSYFLTGRVRRVTHPVRAAASA